MAVTIATFDSIPFDIYQNYNQCCCQALSHLRPECESPIRLQTFVLHQYGKAGYLHLKMQKSFPFYAKVQLSFL